MTETGAKLKREMVNKFCKKRTKITPDYNVKKKQKKKNFPNNRWPKKSHLKRNGKPEQSMPTH